MSTRRSAITLGFAFMGFWFEGSVFLECLMGFWIPIDIGGNLVTATNKLVLV